jgi:queuine/archaeosine tRNA-ribosyltransferase
MGKLAMHQKSRTIIWLVLRGVNTEILSDTAANNRISTNVIRLMSIKGEAPPKKDIQKLTTIILTTHILTTHSRRVLMGVGTFGNI